VLFSNTQVPHSSSSKQFRKEKNQLVIAARHNLPPDACRSIERVGDTFLSVPQPTEPATPEKRAPTVDSEVRTGVVPSILASRNPASVISRH
jgi:hypothetical protein